VVKPNTYKGEYWPKCSFFGVYDGHGGNICADFLHNHLHQYIIMDNEFPKNPVEAIRRGFQRAENEFLLTIAMNKAGELVEKSGSCAIVCMIIDNMCYISNVGDSRALMSINGGKSTLALSTDHKPNHEVETKRIIENGGKIYQYLSKIIFRTQTPTKNLNLQFLNLSSNTPNNYKHSNQMLIGPHRVFPGRLSVSRTFGDVEAKFPKFGGKYNVIVAEPEISSFELSKEIDFIVLGCDGIYDQLNNEDITKCVFLTLSETFRKETIHQQCGLAVDLIMKSALLRKTLDNITCLMICLAGFEEKYNESAVTLNRNETKITIMNYNHLQSTFGGPSDIEQDFKFRIEKCEPKQDINDYQRTNTRKALSNNNVTKNKLETEEESDDSNSYKEYHRQDLILHSGIQNKNSNKNHSQQNLVSALGKTILSEETLYHNFDLVPDINPENFNKKIINEGYKFSKFQAVSFGVPTAKMNVNSTYGEMDNNLNFKNLLNHK
jgi:serine/threonine protein phosphatase PrpC